MFDKVFDTFRNATESALQQQQDFFRQWTNQCSTATTAPLGGGLTEQVQAFRQEWMEGATELLNKQREALDVQYKTALRTIEDSSRFTEAKTPEEFRKLAEELGRKYFDLLKTTGEGQLRGFQAAVEKWFEVLAKPKA
jgi:hypothetical protein